MNTLNYYWQHFYHLQGSINNVSTNILLLLLCIITLHKSYNRVALTSSLQILPSTAFTLHHYISVFGKYCFCFFFPWILLCFNRLHNHSHIAQQNSATVLIKRAENKRKASPKQAIQRLKITRRPHQLSINKPKILVSTEKCYQKLSNK